MSELFTLNENNHKSQIPLAFTRNYYHIARVKNASESDICSLHLKKSLTAWTKMFSQLVPIQPLKQDFPWDSVPDL